MQAEKTVDYIIAGQGLAGSCLAVQLIRRNKRILVLDQPNDNHASAVAAGLFNPFTGKVMARTWMADYLFPYLFAFYSDAEHLLGERFFFPQDLYRPFLSIQEQNGWMGKSTDPGFADYIRGIFTKPSVEHVHDPYGGLLLMQAGRVNVPVFIRAVREFLKKTASWQESLLDQDRLEIKDDHVQYKNIRATGVIFCEGMNIAKNKWFSWLPVNPLKGETITVAMPHVEYIVNRGVYLVPATAPNEFTVGATYDFTSRDPGITEAGRETLESKLSELVTAPYSVTGQQWGIRPTSLDQKIMIGSHPEWPNVLVLNGLGTKGVSQAPYFSAQLAGWLEGENEILPEVNIRRYNALYSKSE